MKKTDSLYQKRNCPSCGAPVVSEICAYCGTATGLNTAEANMEYPVMECREANINFWNLIFPLIFAAAFGISGIIALVVFGGFGGVRLSLIGLPFLLIGLVSAFIAIRTVARFLKVKLFGEMIQARVYGYMDDCVLINGKPAQTVKLLVQTDDGPRVILYQLGNTLKPYRINDIIDIMVYRSQFMICRNK